MELTVNGKKVVAEPRDGQSLLELLRDDLGVRSVKDGCAPEGSCGACTVLVDGHAVVSCAQKATRVEGKHVVTQEGLVRGRAPALGRRVRGRGRVPVRLLLAGDRHEGRGAPRARTPSPRARTSRTRCSGTSAAARATRRSSTRSSSSLPPAEAIALPEPERSGRVGARAPRYEGRRARARRQAVRRRPRRARDAARRAPLLGSPARARRFASTRRGRRLTPASSRSSTAADVPGERAQGSLTKDWRQLVAEGEVTSYVGDVLAAVAAESRHAAREAAALVEVEYEVLDPVTDPFEAMEDDAPLLHADGNVLSVSRVAARRRGRRARGRRARRHRDVPDAVHRARVPRAGVLARRARRRPGRSTCYSQGQGVWEDRRQIASFLALPREQVRVTQVATGGAFGGKEDLNVQCHASLLATVTGRPVLITLSRRESLRFHAKRHPLWLEYTAGCDEDGHLLALRARIVGDTGAYASVGDKVLERAAGHACGAYRVPNVDVEAKAVYTNNPPCGAMRGFGVSQSNFAVEGILDRLAEEVGVDGGRSAGGTRSRGRPHRHRAEARPGRRPEEDAARRPRRVPRGAATPASPAALKNTGIGNGVVEYGRAVLRPEADGTLTLLPLLDGDGAGRAHGRSARSPARSSGSSRARAGRRGHRARARHRPDDRLPLDACSAATPCSTPRASSGRSSTGGRSRRSRARSSTASTSSTGRRRTTPTSPSRISPTGGRRRSSLLDDEGRLAKVIAAHDVGRAINPILIEGQIEGGVHMGLGQALSEELRRRGRRPRHGDAEVAAHRPAERDARGRVSSSSRSRSPKGPTARRASARRARARPRQRRRARLHAYDGIRRTRLPMKDSPAALAAVPHLVRAGDRS